MDVFYNPEGVGDVLIIPIDEGSRYERSHQTVGDVTRILGTDDKLLGYNVFNASAHFNLDQTGRIPLTQALLDKISQLFKTYELPDDLAFDLSPDFVIGYVKETSPHENADKLSVCQVDTGEEQLQIVCGAPNVEAGQKVVVATVGATMPSGMKIKSASLRGVPSSGMICSRKELGITETPEEKGIYVLDDSYQIGEAFRL